MYRTNATPERLGWKAHVEEVRRNVDGVIHSKTLPGFFPSKEAAQEAAQAWIDAKLNPDVSEEQQGRLAEKQAAQAADERGKAEAHEPQEESTTVTGWAGGDE